MAKAPRPMLHRCNFVYGGFGGFGGFGKFSFAGAGGNQVSVQRRGVIITTKVMSKICNIFEPSTSNLDMSDDEPHCGKRDCEIGDLNADDPFDPSVLTLDDEQFEAALKIEPVLLGHWIAGAHGAVRLDYLMWAATNATVMVMTK